MNRKILSCFHPTSCEQFDITYVSMACLHLKSSRPLTSTPSHPTMVTPSKVTVMFINDPLTFLSLHVNQLSHSSDKAISNINFENSLPMLWLWSKGSHIVGPVSNWFALFSLHINQIKKSWRSYFKMLPWIFQGQSGPWKNTPKFLKDKKI